jgi:hypothetical protein
MSEKRFFHYVEAHPSMNEELPLVHSTRYETLRQITTSHSLAPQFCDVFSEPLLYLFYGRPAFRVQQNNRSATNMALCPICFVFKPYIFETVARLFPFDSGASRSGRLTPRITREIADHYELGPSLATARRVASLFFDTNENYFLGTPRPDLLISPDEQEACNYYRLITEEEEGYADHDDRRSAIEIQFRDEISLRDTLLAVILPLSFLRHDDVRKAVFQIWRTYPLDYPTVKGTMPSEYNSVIRERLFRHLKQGGYL